MRENDEDDAPASGSQGSLADGVGETAERGEHESSGEPYGDVDFDDPDTDTGSDDTDVDSGDTYDSDDTYDTDTDIGDTDTDTETDSGETYDSDETYDTEGTYGDGDGTGPDDEPDDTSDGEPSDEVDTSTTGDVGGDEAFVAQDGSPIDGIAFLLDEVRDALFGEDDAAAASPFDTDPSGLETDTDLDLTGDGVVDRADLHEAGSVLDFDVADLDGPGDHHDDGLMDA